MSWFDAVKYTSLAVFWACFIFIWCAAIIPNWDSKYYIYGYTVMAFIAALISAIPSLVILFIGWTFTLI